MFGRTVAPGDGCADEEERSLLERRTFDRIVRFGCGFSSMIVAPTKVSLIKSFVRRDHSLRSRLLVEIVARTKASLTKSLVRRNQSLRSRSLVEIGARTKVLSKGDCFDHIDLFGDVLRRKCCSDNLLLGHGCCMIVASSVSDWRNGRDRTIT